MKIASHIFAISAGLLSLAPLTTLAMGQSTPHEIHLATCDQKADEQSRLLKHQFAQRDVNRDGLLEAAETDNPQMSAACQAKCRDRIDRNHDGVIEAAEIRHA